jgi:hypothetical protein
MTSRTLFSAVALATLSLLTACGGGDAADDAPGSGVAPQAIGGIGGSGISAQGIGGIGGSGVMAQGVGGIGGSGISAQGIGGIGGSGVMAQGVGGIGGSGIAAQAVGGIGGSGVVAQGVGGIGGSGIAAQGIGGIGGSGLMSVASVRACGVQSVNVTIAGARVNQNGAADLNSSGWVDVALAAPVRMDLMTLAAGATLPLDMTTLPAGTYRQMRLLLVAGDAATPLADSVVTNGQLETALAVPSAAQGGLPLATAITVADGQVSASYQDLDVCKSVAATGADTYQLDPVTQGATQVASSL